MTTRQDDLDELECLAQEVNQLKAKLKQAQQMADALGDAAEYNTAMRLNAESAVKRLTEELEQADKSLAKMLADMPTPNQRKALKAMLDNPEQFCADAQW